MKTWNTPEVAELNVTETANGFFDIDWETPLSILGNDKSNQKPSTPSTETETETKDDITNVLS